MAGPHPVIGTGTDWFGRGPTAPVINHQPTDGFGRGPAAPVINHQPELTVPELLPPRGSVVRARYSDSDWALSGDIELVWVSGMASQIR